MANISKIKAVELILKEVNKGTTFTDAFQVISSKYKLNEATFSKYWKEAKAKYEARQQKVEAARTTHEIKKAIHALETKDGQVVDLIRQINDLENDLADGFVTDARWVSDNLVFDKRPMLDKEKIDKVALIAKLKGDIRKILGLEAAKEFKGTVTVQKEFEEATLKGQIKTPDGGKIQLKLDPIE